MNLPYNNKCHPEAPGLGLDNYFVLMYRLTRDRPGICVIKEHRGHQIFPCHYYGSGFFSVVETPPAYLHLWPVPP